MNSIFTLTSKNKEYDGTINIKRKSLDPISLHVRIQPIVCIGRLPTHLVLTIDAFAGSQDTVIPLKEVPRGSLHSIRRGSLDIRSIGSDGLRRTSLAKLSSLPLEAPITKVIYFFNIISLMSLSLNYNFILFVLIIRLYQF